MKRINILNLNHIGWKTGSAQVIDTITQGLPNNQFNYHTLVGYQFWQQTNITSLYKTSPSQLYRTFRYKLPVGLNFLFDRMTSWCINLKYLHNCKFYQEANIIHIHCPQGGYFNRKDLPQICKEKKVVMTMHDDRIVSGNDPDNLYHPYKTRNQYLKRKEVFQQCKMTYIGVSDWITNKVIKDGIHGNNSTKTIYNGINTKVFYIRDKTQCREELWLPQNKKIIISIAGSGGKTNAKGLGYVQQIIKQYKNSRDYLFLTLGNFKEKKTDTLRELWYINQEKVATYFNSSDMFLYPTLMDSFGLVVAESLSCGCPIVTFKTWWVPEIVEHKKTGYVAKSKDLNDLMKGFNRVINQTFDNITLDTKFTQENMVKNYVQLYQTL